VDQIEAALTEHTRAILPVHLTGFPVDIRRLMAVAEKHGIPVIEDACQSVFAAVGGKKVGTFGDTGCISFQEWKSLVSGEGGAILGPDGELMRRSGAFINNGRDPKRELEGYPFPGSNHRMTEFQAAVLTKQYERFVGQDATRQEYGLYLEEELAKIPGLSPRKRYEADTRFTYVQFEMNYDATHVDGVPAGRFAEALRAEGMPFMGGPRRYRETCHREGMLEEHLKTRGFETAFSAARLKAYRETLTFPVMDGLTEPTTEMLVMDSKIPLLSSRREIEGIVEAFHKVSRNASTLL
jgi:dTDP-4-amino-4,6-dideoxygalactose transaminase